MTARDVLNLCIPAHGARWSAAQIEAVNPCLEGISAEERVRWAFAYLPKRLVLSSSFGAQAAVMLHLVSRVEARIPVVFIDTGYLFPETYDFADELGRRLDLDLRVYRPRLSPAWQERRYGRLWEAGREGIRRYNRMNKVEPMERALEELGVGTWFTGLRRSQSDSRRKIGILGRHGGRMKMHPIADWSNRDVHQYLKQHDLPYHPLWDEGYVSIGDTHTSRPLGADMNEQDTRFFGLLRECGLHEPEAADVTG
ncbi:MAG: phosphoadenylyl-sulfate reductase [Xanthomonadales bacterium]|nr:phosphoadenylyl-sulfate reductase [Xanthomonadales bacterium]